MRVRDFFVNLFATLFASVRSFVVATWSRLTTLWASLSPKQKQAAKMGTAVMALAIALFAHWSGSSTPSREPTSSNSTDLSGLRPTPPLAGATPAPHAGTAPNSGVTSTPAQKTMTPYKVKAGEYIIAIAQKLGVPWEAIVVANEKALAALAVARCGKLSESYTKRQGRKGHYCNALVVVGGKPMMNANSLQPGDELRIPSVTAPEQIQQAIGDVKGDRIVVVIDDTGSMNDDRERVSSWYLQAVMNSGKQIVRVIMYADGFYREFDAGNVRFQASGDYENTRAALERAKIYKPDAIVLVSDEPGDDWDGFRNLRLPPVIAHSLAAVADENLARVASETGGNFLRSHTGQIGLSMR